MPYDNQGRVELDISATVSDSLLAQIRATGAKILNSVASGGSVTVSVDIAQVQAIAALSGVTFVQPKNDAMTSQMERPVSDKKPAKTSKRYNTLPDFSTRAANVKSAITTALAGKAQIARTRSLTMSRAILRPRESAAGVQKATLRTGRSARALRST